MNDWVKPPFSQEHYQIWYELFKDRTAGYHYVVATRPNNPNTISVKRMEKFTQACVVARLKGELK